MDVFTYRPGEVIFTVCGFVIEGWTTITVARNAPVFRQVRGIRGKNTRVKMQDSSGTVRINLTQTSIANDVFSEILSLDQNTSSERLEIVIKDSAGTSLFSSTTAYLENFPESPYSASQTERVWTLLCDKMDSYYVGGNSEQALDFGSILSRLGV